LRGQKHAVSPATFLFRRRKKKRREKKKRRRKKEIKGEMRGITYSMLLQIKKYSF